MGEFGCEKTEEKEDEEEEEETTEEIMRGKLSIPC